MSQIQMGDHNQEGDMKLVLAVLPLFVMSACQSSPNAVQSAANSDACGASKYQYLVGGPASAANSLKIDPNSRHYGRAERIDRNIVPTRLNFVVSTDSVIDSITNPKAKIIRVFCG